MADNNAEKALIGRSISDWNRYVEKYVPAEDVLLRGTAVNQSDRSAAAGQVSDMAASQYAAPGMIMGGGSIGSPQVRAVGDLSNAMSSTVARGVSAADREAKAREIRAKMRVASLGRGIADNSSMALASAGARATDNAIASDQRRLDLTQSLVSGAASGAGMYLGYNRATT